MINRIDEQIVVRIHDRQIETYGGAHGLRDRGSLQACLASAWLTFDGHPLYASVQEKAARTAWEIVGQHPLSMVISVRLRF